MGGDGFGGYVEEQERAGQQQVVSSDVLPLEGSSAPDERYDLGELGVFVGDPVDDLFREVRLPAGWRREGSGHSMWSYIVDERGLQRVAVFYKAAFYDRRAHMVLVNPGAAAVTDVVYGDGPVALPRGWDVFTVDERQAFENGLRQLCSEERERYAGPGDRYGPRAREALRLVEAARR